MGHENENFSISFHHQGALRTPKMIQTACTVCFFLVSHTFAMNCSECEKDMLGT